MSYPGLPPFCMHEPRRKTCVVCDSIINMKACARRNIKDLEDLGFKDSVENPVLGNLYSLIDEEYEGFE